MAWHTAFSEVMTGTIRMDSESGDLPIRLELDVDLPGVFWPWADERGALTGRIHVHGRVDDRTAAGIMRLAPIAARQIRYSIAFTTLDGQRLRLDGWKTISWRRPLRSITELPVALHDWSGHTVGGGLLRLDLDGDLLAFLAGFRCRSIAAMRRNLNVD